jgi:myo-inositol-1-phosphate synthase
VIDAIRCARIGLDRGLSGVLGGPASYFMKSPPVQFTDEEARLAVEAFIEGDPSETQVPTFSQLD